MDAERAYAGPSWAGPVTRYTPLLLLLVGCTTSSSNQTPTPLGNSNEATLTGTWQATVDGGGSPEGHKLQFVLIEDAGSLSGVELINDPIVTTQFHTLDLLTGTHHGSRVILQTTLRADTITAAFDGGTLVGVDPFSQPLVMRDGGPAYRLNISFSMMRISTDTSILDGGFQ